jgi:PAS domain S-box-containing protein
MSAAQPESADRADHCLDRVQGQDLLEFTRATEQLLTRPARLPNYQAENQAMHRLARLMVENPTKLLETLVDLALDLCQAGTVGVNRLEVQSDGEPCFRWLALAGVQSDRIGQTCSRHSPCGHCLDQGIPQLYRYPARFPSLQLNSLPLVEALVLPLQTPEGFLGTIWIASHDEQRQFDREDLRMMTSLVNFTAVALQMLEAHQTVECSQQALQQTNSDLDQRIQTRTAELQTEVIDRQTTQAALQQAHSQVVEILESITDAFVALDQNWRYVYVNQEAERLLQKPRSQLLDQVIWHVFPDIAGTLFDVGLRQAVEQQTSIALEEFYSPLDTWFDVRIFPSLNGLSIYFCDISHRKQAELDIAALNRSLQHRLDELQTLFEVVPIGILISHDPDFKQVKANPAFAQILGIPNGDNASYTPSEGETARPAYRIFRNGIELAPDETPLRYAAIHGIPVEGVEVDILRADGVWFNLYGYAAPLFDRQGNVRGSVGAFLDITDRKRQETALRSSAERLSLTLTAARMGDWSWDISSDMVTFSERAAEIFGIPAGAYLTWTQMRSLLHEDDRERVREAVLQAIAEHSDYNVEYRLVCSDGQLCWVAAKGRAHYDATGQALGMIGVVQDITDRKQTEQAIQVLNQNLHHRVAELQTLLDVVPIGIAIAEDPQCQLIRANSFFQKLFGVSPESNLSVNAADQLAIRRLRQGQEIPIDELPLQVAAMQGVEVRNVELQILRSDGAAFDLLGSATPLRNEQGAVRGSVAVFMDISDRKRTESEREQLLAREQTTREQAEAANRVKDEFLAVLSHELRTPLNPILGWVRLLRNGTLDAQKTAFALETIERNTKLQAQLIEDLLDISRILRGKLSLTVASVDLQETIQAAIETVRLSAESKTIDLQTWFTPGGVRVMGDSNRLQQIVWNLLANAIKFTPVGGQISLRLERVGEQAQIIVRDTGQGISSAFLPHIFDYFRQADSSITRQFGGLGLGLAIVRHLVELHGGTVQASSAGENQGATFTVTLPLLRQSAQASNPEVSVPAFTPSCLSGVRVLAVDDDLDSLQLVALVLKQAGATVMTASSAIEALRILEQQSVQVLVSDIGMPAMDGYALLQTVRSQRRSPLAAIALTAYATETDQQQAIASGFQQHLAKPIDPAILVQAVVSQVSWLLQQANNG